MPLTYQQAVAHVERLHRDLSSRRNEIDELERYYRGDHPLRFASDEWRADHARRYRGFSDNWCGVVGSAPGERTEVKGFKVGDDATLMDEAERMLWRDWHRNEMPAQASQGFLQSTIAKRSAVLVWGDDDDEPVVTWEHPAQVIVDHDLEVRRVRRYALKSWIDGDRELATLYAPDEVWKFEREASQKSVTESGVHVVQQWASYGGGGGWRPREGAEPNPMRNPLGVVPVVEFPNRPVLRGEPISDIAGTKAMQDAINQFWAYLFVAADFASMPQRVVMGQQPPKVPILDANGQKVGEQPVDMEKLRSGRMMWLTGADTSIGTFEASRLDVFTGVITVCARHIAAQTKTPLHLIHGELGNVNGETLTAMENPLVSKVYEAHKFYTPAVREVFRLMALVRGDRGLADACRDGRVVWANPETRTIAQARDAALKERQIGRPLEAILVDTLDKTTAEAADEVRMSQAAVIGGLDFLGGGVTRPIRQPGDPAPDAA